MTKAFALALLFTTAMHYVFVAAFTSKVTEWSSVALIALVLVGAVAVAATMPEDKP